MIENKLPNFLIVGTMKSGTTSLYQYLKQHPEIYFPREKEPRFFVSSGLLKIGDTTHKFQHRCKSEPYSTLDEYLKLFEDVKKEKAIGEASPHYLFTYRNTIPLIKKYLGKKVKIIIIIRDPAERAFSAYKHNFINNPISSFKETLSFEEALKIEDERLKFGIYPMMFFYKEMGLYYQQVKAYKDNFEDVFICLNEELRVNSELLIENLFNFLQVDPSFKANLNIKYNESINIRKNIFYNFLKKKNHPVKRNLKKVLYPLIGEKKLAVGMNLLKKINSNKTGLELKDSTKKELTKYFKDDIIKLECLIEKDLSEWLKH